VVVYKRKLENDEGLKAIRL